MSHTTIRTRHDHEVGWITLNRPKIHNAFNSAVVSELSAAFAEMEKDPDNRVVILTGAGKLFCAGGDLDRLRSVAMQSFDENLVESNALANLFWRIYSFKRLVIARVNGAAIGGGAGFVTACDITVAARPCLEAR